MKQKQVQELLRTEREGTLTTEQAGKLEAHRAYDRKRQSAKRQRDRDHVTVAAPQSIADAYRDKNIPYKCHECRRKERSGVAAVGKALAVEYKQPESTIFDSWGRIEL